jgi:hypothetical protein
MVQDGCPGRLRGRPPTRETPPAPTGDLARLIVGDLHGDWRNRRGLLGAVGALEDAGNRREGWWLAPVGDLIHGGHHAAGDALPRGGSLPVRRRAAR